jgi:hypothetical protein
MTYSTIFFLFPFSLFFFLFFFLIFFPGNPRKITIDDKGGEKARAGVEGGEGGTRILLELTIFILYPQKQSLTNHRSVCDSA